MEDKVTLLVVCLFYRNLHVSNYENIKASEIGVLNFQVVKEEDGNIMFITSVSLPYLLAQI